MPKITFVEANGAQHVVQVPVGGTVMDAAKDNLIPGIVADCGGACSCATCHGYVDAAWLDRMPAADETEKSMLQCALEPRDTSRLTCQIFMTDELDGLVVEIPASQG